MIADYEEGGLKDFDIVSKFEALRLTWVKRLFDENHHPWKNIPLKLLDDSFKQNVFFANSQISFSEFLSQNSKKLVKNDTGTSYC